MTTIEEISGVINEINDISNTIASAVEEQTATTNEIGRNVGMAAQGAGDISQNISGGESPVQQKVQPKGPLIPRLRQRSYLACRANCKSR